MESKKELLMAFIILEKLMIGCLGRQCGRF